MAPVNTEKKSWKEVNKTRKEERKKWKEKALEKKVEKEKLKEAAAAAVPASITESPATLSIAVPGSIMENAQSPELRTYLAGQIARAACIFQVDEIIVFDDYGDVAGVRKGTIEDEGGELKKARRCCVQLGRILQYLECPQYLRKFFFPIHNDLKFAGILNPLDAPHHLRAHNNFTYREGIVSNKPVKPGHGSMVNVGLLRDVHVDKHLTPGIRCTVRLEPRPEGVKKIRATVVSPTTPRKETGVYWGYTVRIANSLSQVFSQSPYKDGYDLTIGTSDRGEPIDTFSSPKYNHVLILFGGLQGIEAALESDEALQVDDPALLFDHYLNALPNQGSRTIRTEEAVLVTLAALSSKLDPNVKAMVFTQHEDIAQSNNSEVRKHSSEENSSEVRLGEKRKHSSEENLSRFD